MGDIRDADVHIRDLTACPQCGANWQGVPIPEGVRKHTEGYPSATHYSLLVGYEHAYDHPDHYDGVSLWLCPACKAAWDRWTGKLTDLVWDPERGLVAPC